MEVTTGMARVTAMAFGKRRTPLKMLVSPREQGLESLTVNITLVLRWLELPLDLELSNCKSDAGTRKLSPQTYP